MIQDQPLPEATLWVDEVYLNLISQVIPLMKDAVRFIGVGGPRITGVDQLARKMNLASSDDLRQMVNNLPSAYLVLATVHPVACQDMQSAMLHGATILSTEPPADRFEDLPFAADSNASHAPSLAISPVAHAHAMPALPHPGWFAQTPDFTQSPGWLQATDPAQALGDLQAINLHSMGSAGEGSLWARLNDAWSALLTMTELPETVDASLSGTSARSPHDPRAWTGYLHIHARSHQGPGAVLQLSDQSSRSRRSLHIFGDAGSCTIQNQAYQLLDSRGQLLDQSPVAENELSTAQMIALQWHRLMDHPPVWQPRLAHHAQQVLAVSLACLLSCRTGQPENPASILQMHRNLT